MALLMAATQTFMSVRSQGDLIGWSAAKARTLPDKRRRTAGFASLFHIALDKNVVPAGSPHNVVGSTRRPIAR